MEKIRLTVGVFAFAMLLSAPGVLLVSLSARQLPVPHTTIEECDSQSDINIGLCNEKCSDAYAEDQCKLNCYEENDRFLSACHEQSQSGDPTGIYCVFEWEMTREDGNFSDPINPDDMCNPDVEFVEYVSGTYVRFSRFNEMYACYNY